MFVIAGVINSIIGGISLLLSILIFALKGVVETILTTGDTCQQLVDELIAGDSNYEYLSSYTQEQVVDFVWGLVTQMLLFVILIALVVIMFAVFNFIFSKKHNEFLKNKKTLGTVLVVFSWVFMAFNIANIFTTLGVYLRVKDNNQPTISAPTDGKGYSRY